MFIKQCLVGYEVVERIKYKCENLYNENEFKKYVSSEDKIRFVEYTKYLIEKNNYS